MHALSVTGSFVLGGFLLAQILALSGTVGDQLYSANAQRITLEHAVSCAELLEHDLRRMGLGLADPRSAIVAASDTAITFFADVDADDIPEQVRYFLGGVDSAAETANPDDRVLYRLIDDEDENDIAFGVVRFHVRLFDATGNETSQLGSVRSIDYALDVALTDPIDGLQCTTRLEGRVYPKNFSL